MRVFRSAFFAGILAALTIVSVHAHDGEQRVEGASVASGGPRYAVDATWPNPLPNNWILGQVAGVAVAFDDSIWMMHRALKRRRLR